MTNTGPLDKLSVVMKDGQWNWPMITDIACLEITYMLPPISEGQDRISWKSNDGSFNTSTAYDLFRQPGPKVVWSSLLLGPFKIPKNCFILWLAIMGKLSTLDKPWLHHTDNNCILCPDGVPETHDHLFFTCSFSADVLPLSDSRYHFFGPTVIGNQEYIGRHPDGVESMNAIRDDSSNVVGHPRLWEILWLKSLDKGSLAFSYGRLLAHLVCTDYGKSLGLSRGFPTDLFVLFVLLQ
ncbi:UNVERIFIED_CONTAM: hypothetical protein Scaly_0484200 [Sesamum calycinum]|uniref:Reverse transcriptase zinc-binding domain-containing protein n=1 Tax=Sesamum calycinum TaxID=2727403 RepID=A0AAW2RPI3_9LAMI